ncbi:MAG: hypothetical protein WBD40_02430 [Tepidisphaeraceae bacterium]
MKRRLIMWYGTALLLLCSPMMALAQDDETPYIDARLEGYATPVALEGASSALTWVLFIILAVLALGGMFKDAKRTHLD